MRILDRLRQPGWLRRALVALGLLLGLIITIRIVLDPIAAHFTRKQLNESAEVSGDFQRVHVTLLPPGYEIRRFQAANDLPATGVPDHETVRRLGLNPDDLFRKAAQ